MDTVTWKFYSAIHRISHRWCNDKQSAIFNECGAVVSKLLSTETVLFYIIKMPDSSTRGLVYVPFRLKSSMMT